MNKAIILISIFWFSISAFGQQVPLYSQYTQHGFLYNPALTNEKGGSKVSIIGRKQYTFLSNALNTAGVFYQGELSERSKIGLWLVNDQTGLATQNHINANYAYVVPFSGNNKMTLGMAIGYYDRRYDNKNFVLEHEDDDVINELQSGGNGNVDANFGVTFNLGNFDVGMAFLQLMQSDEKFIDNYNNPAYYGLSRHFNFHLGYLYRPKETVSIRPNFIYRTAKDAPSQIDIGATVDFENKLWAGVTYRDGYALSTNFGLHLAQKFDVGYAFDFSVHKYRSALSGAHELMLSYNLNATKSVSEPVEVAETSTKVESEALEKYDDRLSRLENKVDVLALRKGTKDTVVLKQVVVKQTGANSKSTRTTTSSNSGNSTTNTTTTKPQTTSTPNNSSYSYNPDGKYFYVVTGTFGDEKNARVYQNSLRQKGITSYLKKSAKNNYYYIYLNRFNTKEEAKTYHSKNNTEALKLWIKEM